MAVTFILLGYLLAIASSSKRSLLQPGQQYDDLCCADLGEAIGQVCACRQSCGGNSCNGGLSIGGNGGKRCEGTAVCCCGDGCNKPELLDADTCPDPEPSTTDLFGALTSTEEPDDDNITSIATTEEIDDDNSTSIASTEDISDMNETVSRLETTQEPTVCGENEEYTTCGTACPAKCADILGAPRFCILPCIIGCQCKDGFILDVEDGECIPIENCPTETEAPLVVSTEDAVSTTVEAVTTASASTDQPATTLVVTEDSATTEAPLTTQAIDIETSKLEDPSTEEPDQVGLPSSTQDDIDIDDLCCEELGEAFGVTCACRQSCGGSSCNAGLGGLLDQGLGGGRRCVGPAVCCCGTGCKKPILSEADTCEDVTTDFPFIIIFNDTDIDGMTSTEDIDLDTTEVLFNETDIDDDNITATATTETIIETEIKTVSTSVETTAATEEDDGQCQAQGEELYWAFRFDKEDGYCDICVSEISGKASQGRCDRVENILDFVVDEFSSCVLDICDYGCAVGDLVASANANDAGNCGCGVLECVVVVSDANKYGFIMGTFGVVFVAFGWM